MILEEGAEIISTPVGSVQVTPAGFLRDRHAGLTRRAGSRDAGIEPGEEIPNRRQVSIVSQEELAEISSRLGIPEVRAQWLGANLCLSGIKELTRLPHGTRLAFAGGVELAVEGENKPCRGPGEAIAAHYPERDGIARRFPTEALHLRGLVAWVEEPGEIAVGEAVEVRRPELSELQ